MRDRRARFFVLIALLATTAFVTHARAVPVTSAIIVVTTTEDELKNNGQCSLREAILAANTDIAVDTCPAGSGADTISLPRGVFALTASGGDEDKGLTGDLDITASLTITGVTSDTTIIDGNQQDRVFDFHGDHVSTLAHITIQYGNVTDSNIPFEDVRQYEGGGVRDSAGRLTLYKSTVVNNSAIDGGGIMAGRELAIIESVIANNQALDDSVDSDAPAGQGGAIYGGSTLQIESSQIFGNSAQGGGVIDDAWSGGLETMIITNSNIRNNIGALGSISYEKGGNLQLTDSIIDNNIGGGINLEGVDAYVADSKITNNMYAVNLGSGIHSVRSALTITNSVISTNTGRIEGGGAILASEPRAVNIRKSTISGNIGSGIEIVYADATAIVNIIESTISNNKARVGGGIASHYVTLYISNSTISGNEATDHGGGIYASSPPDKDDRQTIINNTTITHNIADSDSDGNGDGGGVYHKTWDDQPPQGPTSAMRIQNVILASNLDRGGQAPECAGSLHSESYNLIQHSIGCTISGSTERDHHGKDPLLGPLQHNGGATWTHALLPGSPAIDAGNPASPGNDSNACLPYDQRGTRRPLNVRCDIGAYEGEYDGPALATITGLGPERVIANSGAFTLIITGRNFLPGARVFWNGVERPTTFISASQLTAAIAATDIVVVGQVPITVANPNETTPVFGGYVVTVQAEDPVTLLKTYLPLLR